MFPLLARHAMDDCDAHELYDARTVTNAPSYDTKHLDVLSYRLGELGELRRRDRYSIVNNNTDPQTHPRRHYTHPPPIIDHTLNIILALALSAGARRVDPAVSA